MAKKLYYWENDVKKSVDLIWAKDFHPGQELGLQFSLTDKLCICVRKDVIFVVMVKITNMALMNASKCNRNWDKTLLSEK
jgi:hypothetical protein